MIVLQEGAFDEAVKGVDAIMHMASPFTDKNNKVKGTSNAVAVLL